MRTRMMLGVIVLAVAGLAHASGTAGSLDDGFGTDGIVVEESFDGGAAKVFAQTVELADGSEEVRFLAIGPAVLAPAEDEPRQFAVARYRPDGALDTSFGTNGIAEIDLGTDGGVAADLAFDADGKLVVVGRAVDVWFVTSGKGKRQTTTEIRNEQIAVVRLDTDGTLDTTFGGGDGILLEDLSEPSRENEGATAVAILTDGDILVGASATFTIEVSGGSGGKGKKGGGSTSKTASGAILLRYNAQDSFALDTSFGGGDGVAIDTQFVFGDGYFLGTGIVDMAVQAGSRRIVTLTGGHHNMIRGYDLGTGALDADTTRFGTNGSGWIETTSLDDYHALAIGSDGRILVCGERRDTANVDGLGDGVLTRFDADGTGIQSEALVTVGSDASELRAIAVDGARVVCAGDTNASGSKDAFVAWFDAPVTGDLALDFASARTTPGDLDAIEWVYGIALSGSDAVVSGGVNSPDSDPLTVDWSWFLAKFRGS